MKIMGIVEIDSERVMYAAYELWKADLEDGEYDDDEFATWLCEEKGIDEDVYEIDPDAARDKYLDEWLKGQLEGEIPDSYIERAGEDFSDDASDHGYTARFI